MVQSAAQKQRAYRERLRLEMTDEQYQEHKRHIARLSRSRYKKKKLFECVLKQLQEWFNAFKEHYSDDDCISSSPLFVPATPFFQKIANEARLNENECRVWKILFHGLSVWPKVSAGSETFLPVMAYGMERKFVYSAIEKLIGVKAVMYQENDCLGLVTFFRGEAWPAHEEFQASFDILGRYMSCYEASHCDDKHPLRH